MRNMNHAESKEKVRGLKWAEGVGEQGDGIQDRSSCCKCAEKEGNEQQKVVVVLLEGVWSYVSEKAAGFERRECYLELQDAL